MSPMVRPWSVGAASATRKGRSVVLAVGYAGARAGLIGPEREEVNE
jgi:hypothetical protein